MRPQICSDVMDAGPMGFFATPLASGPIGGSASIRGPQRRIDCVALALIAMTGIATQATLYGFVEFIAWA